MSDEQVERLIQAVQRVGSQLGWVSVWLALLIAANTCKP